MKVFEFTEDVQSLIKKNYSPEQLQEEILKLLQRQQRSMLFLLTVLADELCLKALGQQWLGFLLEKKLFNSSCGGQVVKQKTENAFLNNDYEEIATYGAASLIQGSELNKEKASHLFPKPESAAIEPFFGKIKRSSFNFWLLVIPGVLFLFCFIEMIFVVYYGSKLGRLLEAML
jgi:hypothetical protein